MWFLRMTYIIEKAMILKEKQLIASSILVQNDRIASLKSDFKQYTFMRMNAESYIMTPTYCLLNKDFPLNLSADDLKEYLINHFLLKGCTCYFTCIHLSLENELSQKMDLMKKLLLNCPIDYLIGVRIPLSLLTPSLIRKCKKEKIPALFIDIDNPDQLDEIAWGWIKDALFPYNCPLIPVISTHDKKEARGALSKWIGIMAKERIPAILEEIEENTPLSKNILNKIGLYPHKSSLMHGTELSYNLYLKETAINIVDEQELFHYHGDRLVITVHKGQVIRAGKEVLIKPGNGEHVKVRTPSFFSL
jgi:hypothetical protein